MNIELFVVIEGTWIVFRTLDATLADDYARELVLTSRHSVSVRQVMIDLENNKVDQFTLAV